VYTDYKDLLNRRDIDLISVCTPSGMHCDMAVEIGKAGINIAAMQWSRSTKGDKAVSFVSIDNPVSDDVLENIVKIDGVLKASRLKF
jgi:L-serine deaminase